MIDASEHRAEGLAVGDHPADRNPTEPDTVIPSLAADEPRAGALATRLVVGERDLQRRLDRFRSRCRQQHMIEITRRHQGQSRSQRERIGVRILERRREIEPAGRLLDGFGDGRAAVAGVHAIEPRRRIQNLAPVRRCQKHARRARKHPRPLLERAVRRKRHPIGFEFVGVHALTLTTNRPAPPTWRAQVPCCRARDRPS